jgi:hypothetical protein
MTSQQIADELLAEHQAARFRLAVTRSEALYHFYVAERNAGVDALTANERTHEHAKRLDTMES